MPILTTKLYIPPTRPDWVPRQRLIKRLDQGLRRKLTLLSAPAGYGKTTLITAWLHGLNERLPTPPRVAWLSLEEDDNDLARFLAYFIAAWQKVDEGIGQTVLPLLGTPQLPDLTHLITLLINDLANLPDQCLLVLDDYHTIHHPDVQTAVFFFLDHLPPQLHLIMATREEPQLPLARLRVQWQVTEIRWQELRFTTEETSTFLNQTMGLNLDSEAVQTLESRTEGWIAGLQMAALAMRASPGHRGLPGYEAPGLALDDFGRAQRYVIDYLAAEVFHRQSTEIRTFLRQTAILDRLCASLCDAVTGQHNSHQFLAQLEQANLFLAQLDEQRYWYAYHSLFADFLRTELAEWEEKALHQKASDWFEANGFRPEAIKHALAAVDLATAERLIRNSVEETFSRGAFTTLLGWLNALPEEIVRGRSDFAVYKGWILYLRGEVTQAETYAAIATEAQHPDDPAIQQGLLLAFRAYLAINRGDPAQAVRLGQEALALLGDTESFLRTTVLSHLGQAQRLAGDRKAAIQTLRQALSLSQQLGHALIAAEAVGYLTRLLYEQGQLREAILLCQQAVSQYSDGRGKPLPVAGLVYIPLGVLYYETNEMEEAEHYLTSGIALCQQMGTVYYTLLGQRTLAKLRYARGDIEAAWETLAAAHHLAAQSENEQRIRAVNAVSVELQLRQGMAGRFDSLNTNPEHSRRATPAVHLLADLPASIQARSEQENLVMARLWLAQGQPQKAHDLLGRLEQVAQKQDRISGLIMIYVLQALVEQVLQHPDAALDRLAEAISLAAHGGYRRAFLDEGTAVADLLAARRHLAPDFVDSLLAALPTPSAGAEITAVASTQSEAPGETLIEPLSGAQLAILRLVAEGLSNQAIADKMSITVGTTKWHLSQIYGLLNVSSRTQAVAKARRLQLL